MDIRWTYRVEDTANLPVFVNVPRSLITCYVLQMTAPNGITYDYDWCFDATYARLRVERLNRKG